MMKNITTIIAFCALIFVVGFGAWYYNDLKSVEQAVTEVDSESNTDKLIKDTETQISEKDETETEFLTDTEFSQNNVFSFTDIDNKIFEYTNGTEHIQMIIYSDGSFIGEYQNVKEKESSLLYPNGTILYNEFVGQFSEPKMNSIDACSFSVTNVELKYKADTSETKNDVLYEYTNIEDINFGDEFNLKISESKNNINYALSDLNTGIVLKGEY